MDGWLAQQHIKKERKLVNGEREYCYVGINVINAT
jgi:hypothetical protein